MHDNKCEVILWRDNVLGMCHCEKRALAARLAEAERLLRTIVYDRVTHIEGFERWVRLYPDDEGAVERLLGPSAPVSANPYPEQLQGEVDELKDRLRRTEPFVRAWEFDGKFARAKDQQVLIAEFDAMKASDSASGVQK